MRKNDVRNEDLSVEYKYTDKRQYPLKLSDLEKAEEYALLDGRTMLFGVSFSGKDYIIMTADDFHTLYEGQRLSWR